MRMRRGWEREGIKANNGSFCRGCLIESEDRGGGGAEVSRVDEVKKEQHEKKKKRREGTVDSCGESSWDEEV